MSVFEIFAVTPPPFVVECKNNSFNELNSPDLSWLNVAEAAARAGHCGVIDLQFAQIDDRQKRIKISEKLACLLKQEYSGKFGLRYNLSQMADVDLLLSPEPGDGRTHPENEQTNLRKAGSSLDFVIVSTLDAAYSQLFSTQAFKRHAENLKAAGIRFFVEVVSLKEARLAEAAGADALFAKGCESEGRVGELTAYVLCQQLTDASTLPVIVQGGIGMHSAAACYAVGAKGVVLTSQLMLTREAGLPIELAAKLEQFDGSETSQIGLVFPDNEAKSKDQNLDLHYRVYAKTNSPFFEYLKESAPQEIVGKISQHALSAQPLDYVFPLGQDAALAEGLVSKYRSVAGVLSAIQSAVDEHVKIARDVLALAPGSPLARSHGTAYPIVQGAMTRVSDTADFADKVSNYGGLPFLALALMRKSEIEVLLAQTKTKLQDRPWGVGLLGFVPNQLRQEQLEAIDQCKPDYALIAGGRPDQAKFLEDRGIKTYLHVPSPALLASFIEMGSRRFIFEGSECGGHIGPRSSFVLWDSMIEQLLHNVSSRDDAGKYHIIFAGGIHDAKSAAMVAAMSAPLSQRGMKVGVLMGTAYLFTEEAVAAGAIVEQFQKSALACDQTVLLETGPGHAIRCMKSPYKQIFDQRRNELIGEKRSREEIREELELMNLGRLRIASKGLTRPGQLTKKQVVAEMAKAPAKVESELEAVTAQKQWRDGMYMIGQVASLRDSVTTIKDLHEHVSCRGVDLLQNLKTSTDQSIHAKQQVPKEPVAIIGMACLFPKASSVEAFWQNILNKVDTIEEVPLEQWDWRNFYDEDPLARDKIYSKWGGFLEPVEFEPTKYGIPPASLQSIDPMQILLLEVTEAALKDAGYAERSFPRERTSVILANAGHGPITAFYSLRSMLGWKLSDLDDATKKHIEDKLPEWTEDSFPGYLGNVTAGRVANRFDLGGVNYSIDAACASSLAALHAAMADLRSGNSDVVLLSATDTHNQPGDYLSFSKTHAFSAQGRCRTFDQSADGIVISEGMAMIVLKRLKDAERDGDRIYAVIRGVGGSSDGRDLSLTAPRPAGQKLALRRAYEDAGISPKTVSLVEAHGTGTVAGDRAEVEALKQVFEEHGAAKRSCAIGSVKTMIGHTKTAAGLASLIKVAKSLYHRVLPPTIGVTNPNPACNFQESPFYISSESRPWLLRDQETNEPRRAGVSAFGFGGTNFHAVLEEHIGSADLVPEERNQRTDDSELFVFHSRNSTELIKALTYFQEHIKRMEFAQGANSEDVPVKPNLAALARDHYLKTIEGRSLNLGSREKSEPSTFNSLEEAVLSIVATSISDLQDKLVRAIAALQDGKTTLKDPRGIYYGNHLASQPSKIAFLFPGQGSQHLNMLKDLAFEFNEVKTTFEQGNRVLSGVLGAAITDFIFPPPSFSAEEESSRLEALTDTHIAQPALACADVAALELLKSFAVKPDMVAGHSFGEYVALYAAQTLSFADLLTIAEIRGRLLAQASGGIPGAMAAVNCSANEVQSLLPKMLGVVVANINGPSQTVVAGDLQSIEEAIEKFKQNQYSAKRINVAQAFHTKFMEPAASKLKAELEKIDFASPVVTVYSNLSAKPYTESEIIQNLPSLLSSHTIAPVDFVGQIKRMYQDGARLFLEVGPGGVLSQLVGSILGDEAGCSIISLDRVGRNGRLSLLHCLGQLSALGVRVNLRRLFASRSIGRHLQAPPAAGHRKGARLRYLVTSASIKPITASSANQSIHPPHPDLRNPQRNSMAKNGAENNGSHDSSSQAAVNKTGPLAEPRASTGSANFEHIGKADTHNLRTPNLENAKPFSGKSDDREVDRVMLQFQQTMLQMTNNFLETQQRVMLAYLQGQDIGNLTDQNAELVPAVVTKTGIQEELVTGNGIIDVEAISQTGGKEQQIASATSTNAIDTVDGRLTVVSESALSTAPNGKLEVVSDFAQECDAEFLVNSLLDIVSQRTGYPVEMLDPSLDLEADLGIDSIKRVEILNSFRRILPVNKREQLESGIEELAGTKTLQGIIDWLRAGESVNGNGQVSELLSLAVLHDDNNGAAQTTAERLEYGHKPVNGDGTRVASTPKARDLQALTSITLEALGGHADGIARGNYASGKLKRAVVVKKSLESAVGGAGAKATSARKLILITADQYGLAEKMAETLGKRGFVPVILHHKKGASANVSAQEKQFSLDLNETDKVDNLIAQLRIKHGSLAGLVHLLPLQSTGKQAKPSPQTNSFDPLPVYSLFALLRSLHVDLSDAGAETIRIMAASNSGAQYDASRSPSSVNSGSSGSISQAGLAGVIKTAQKEYEESKFRLVDLDNNLSEKGGTNSNLTDLLIREFFDEGAPIEVVYRDQQRLTLETQPSEIAASNSGKFCLDKDSVVFVTGGARGITGDVVLDLATRFQSRFVIVGRSSLPPASEEVWLQGLDGAKSIKSAVIERMKSQGLVVSVPMVEAEYQRILREREIRHYLGRLTKTGATFTYHAVDVRDEKALANVIAETYKSFGKIDLAIHGAGIIEDAYIKDKTLHSFQRVFETKVQGALTLAKYLKLESLDRLVLFSSVVGREGNPGQVDYVAANEVINKLARSLNAKVKGRAVSIMWGPWKGGMAQPELESVFASYGWAMIDIPLGCQSFVEEISRGDANQPEVVIVAELSHEDELTPRGPKMHSSKVHRINEKQFEFAFEVGAAMDLYLSDHTFDGIPVMPMAGALELMAEAVSSLYPNLELVAVSNFDIPAGIVFDTAKKKFSITTRELEHDEKHVTVQAELSSGNVRKRVNFRARFELRPGAVAGSLNVMPLAVPQQLNFELDKAGLGNLVELPSVPEIYDQWLFHGPRFQGIETIQAIGTHGVIGTVARSSPKDNIAGADNSPWQIDPIMLDSAMQLAGIWARKFLESTVLPTGFKRLIKYSELDEGPVTARVFMQPETSASELVCNLALYSHNGVIALVLEGLGGVSSKSLNRLSKSAGVGSKK